MKAVKSRRPYRSERRKEQARSTRAAIMESARRLFAERGYTATTIEAIAAAAGVAAITVYSVFGSKRRLLAEMIATAVSGDQAPAPVYEQERARAVLRQPDQRRQIAGFADHMWEILERVSPLFEVLDQASSAESDMAELRRDMLRERLDGMRVFVRALAARGRLRPRLTMAGAAETVWAVTAPQLFRLLTRDLGWDRARWVSWVSATLSAALLPAGATN